MKNLLRTATECIDRFCGERGLARRAAIIGGEAVILHGIPRTTIDIDILLFGGRIIRQKDLTVPHPLMKERQFVLIPLLELQPDLRDPESGRPLSEALQVLEDQGVYIFRA